jgi:hypothetical protein
MGSFFFAGTLASVGMRVHVFKDQFYHESLSGNTVSPRLKNALAVFGILVLAFPTAESANFNRETIS